MFWLEVLGLARFSSAQLSSAQPSSAQLSSAEVSSAQLSSARLRSVQRAVLWQQRFQNRRRLRGGARRTAAMFVRQRALRMAVEARRIDVVALALARAMDHQLGVLASDIQIAAKD